MISILKFANTLFYSNNQNEPEYTGILYYFFDARYSNKSMLRKNQITNLP